MSTEVDSKVVEMKFDNKGFAEGVKGTISGLNSLSQTLSKVAGVTGLDNLGKAADRVGQRFSLMRVAVVAAVGTIASQATRAAENVVKSFTTGPIMDGFKNYETQINAVQTILANTGLEGKKGIGQVNAVLADLNDYANKTVYNFSEMTRNIGTFTAAGVKLKPAADAIQGIANLAALSGSTSDQASTAMYQLSQAIAANKVGLQDWNSVVNAGLGGKIFQKALFNTGQVLHTVKGAKIGQTFEQWEKAGNSFRNSLHSGWITGKVLTTTLSQFTGKLTDAQLKSMGYNAEQIKSIQKLAKVAAGAATNIKTFTQLTQALKEEVATGYAAIFKTIFGDITTATALFSPLHTVIENALTNPLYKVNKVLQGWVKLGGRTRLLDGIQYALKDIKAILTPIDHAFRDIFPAVTAKRLYSFTNNLEKFFQFAKIGATTAQNLKRTFKGVFAVFDIGRTAVKALAHFIGDLFGQLTKGEGSKGFLAITAHIGDFLVKLDQTIKKGHIFTNFFNSLLGYLKTPIKYFHELTQSVNELFGGKATKGGNDLQKKLSPLQTIPGKISTEWNKLKDTFQKAQAYVQNFAAQIKPFAVQVVDSLKKVFGYVKQAGDVVKKFFSNIDWAQVGAGLLTAVNFIIHGLAHITAAVQSIWNFLKPFGPKIVAFFKSIGHGIGDIFSHLDFSQVLHTINTGLFATLVILLKKFLGTAGKTVGSAGGFISTIKEPFEQLTGTLKSMQQTLKAAVLLQIAIAIGILAASCFVLAGINSTKLTSALQAVGAMMAELLGSLVVFGKVGGIAGIAATASGIVLFAGAILILTSAVVKLSKIDPKAIASGLQSLGILMGETVIAAKQMGKAAPLMISGGLGLLAMSAAIKVLASVVVDLGKVDIKTLQNGLESVGALLGGLAIFTKIQEADAGGVVAGAGLIAVAFAIKTLGDSVKFFGTMDTKVLRKGLIAVGAILAGFALFSRGVGNPASVIAAAAAMVIISLAMGKLGDAVERFGNFSWQVIGKGLTVMAGALAAIALALGFLPPTVLLSAAAIFVVASSLKQIGDAMVVFGGMSWEAIAKGIVTLAGALTIIAAASLVMTTALPGAAAMLVVAAALKVLTPELIILGQQSWENIGKGLVALAGAFAVIGVAGLLLTPVIPSLFGLGASIALLGAGIALIGGGVFLLGAGLTAIAAAGAGAAIVLAAVVTAIVKLVPVIASALVDGVTVLVNGLAKNLPVILSAVEKILLQLIGLIVKVAPPLIDAIILLLTKILNTLEAHAPKFFKQMVGLLLSLLQAIEAKTPQIVKSVLNIVVAIVQGLAYHVKDFIVAGGDIVINIIRGLTARVPDIVAAAVDFIIAFVGGLAQQAVKLANAALDMIVTIINGLADAIRSHTPELISAGENLADAIIKGLVHGLSDVGGKVKGAVEHLGGSVVGWFKDKIDSHSPSKVFIKIGHDINDGLIIGIREGAPGVKNAFQSTSQALQQGIKDTAQSIVDFKQKLSESQDKVKKTGDQVAVYTQKIAEASSKHKESAASLLKLNQELANAKKAHGEASVQVDKYTKLVAQAKNENLASKAGLAELNRLHLTEGAVLTELGKKHDSYIKDLEKQKGILKDLIQVRDDYNKSVVDEFNVLPDITTDTTVQSFTTGLQESVADLAKFTDILGQLRAAGIDDATYKLLVSKGPAALPFMEALLASGSTGINNINALDSQLNAEAQALGSNASSALYQAGIDVVQGLVDGLAANADNIQKQMDHIAKMMVDAIKQALQIHSPSKVMAVIGRFAGSGVVVGLKDSVSSVADAAANLGHTAKTSLQNSISNMLNTAVGIGTFNPTITPVLDLSAVQKRAGDLSGMLQTGPVLVTDAYVKAIAASSSYQANVDAVAARADQSTTQSPAASSIAFTQNNYSPKALSRVEIYRQTNNQISVAKGALSNAAKRP